MQPEQRSDNLLPTDDQVAEEVSTDQQSQRVKRTGQMPPPAPPAPVAPAAGAPDIDQAVADSVGARPPPAE